VSPRTSPDPGPRLTKRFGTFTAVDDIDFQRRAGRGVRLPRPNGAGKSSTMRMVGAVSPVTAGDLRILGGDPAVDGPRIRARLGVVPQEDTLDLELTCSRTSSSMAATSTFRAPRQGVGPGSCSTSSS